MTLKLSMLKFGISLCKYAIGLWTVQTDILFLEQRIDSSQRIGATRGLEFVHPSVSLMNSARLLHSKSNISFINDPIGIE